MTTHKATQNNSVFSLHHGHDATIVYIKDGEIVEAMSEERLSRNKKHIGFPHKTLTYIKNKYNITSLPVVYVVGDKAEWDNSIFYTDKDNEAMRKAKFLPSTKEYLRALQFVIPPLHKFLNNYYRIKQFTTFSSTAKRVNSLLAKEFPQTTIKRIHHHLAHAWAAVPFIKNKSQKYLIFTLDGAGDNISGSVNIFDNGNITRIKEMPFDASIGLLYNGVVSLLGMKPNEHEFKVMGLAPYAKKTSGEVVYNELKKLVWFDHKSMALASSIPANLSLSYFVAHNFHNYRFDSLAYGIQKLTEECTKELVLAYVQKYNIPNVALGGGVFMNVKANQILLGCKEIDNLVITPSCGDESLALGAAVYGFVNEGNDINSLKPLKNIYLGSSYSNDEIGKAIENFAFSHNITIQNLEEDSYPIEKKVAELLASGEVVGRFKGRAEWGARALGNRSILANASKRDTVKLINEMIKGRDFWMPFATSLLYEDQHDYLDNPRNFFAPYMSVTFETKKRAESELSAALHPYDLTSRPQMVTKEMNNDYHTLISEFKKLTNSSGILNTSFNLHGEPNVETPYDALRTFDLSGLNHLAIGSYLLSKKIADPRNTSKENNGQQ